MKRLTVLIAAVLIWPASSSAGRMPQVRHIRGYDVWVARTGLSGPQTRRLVALSAPHLGRRRFTLGRVVCVTHGSPAVKTSMTSLSPGERVSCRVGDHQIKYVVWRSE